MNNHPMGENLNQEGKGMIHQGILPFKLEITQEEITPRSGLVLYAEVSRAMRIRDRIERYLPQPHSNRGYRPFRFMEPLLFMLHGGGRHIEDLREIRDDEALRKLVDMDKMPSLSTFGDCILRLGEEGGIEGMDKLNE